MLVYSLTWSVFQTLTSFLRTQRERYLTGCAKHFLYVFYKHYYLQNLGGDGTGVARKRKKQVSKTIGKHLDVNQKELVRARS